MEANSSFPFPPEKKRKQLIGIRKDGFLKTGIKNKETSQSILKKKKELSERQVEGHTQFRAIGPVKKK
jgi:hypothetical protein